jgi:hypothetical protein
LKRKKYDAKQEQSEQDIIQQPAPLFEMSERDDEFRFFIEKEKHDAKCNQCQTNSYSVERE